MKLQHNIDIVSDLWLYASLTSLQPFQERDTEVE